MSLQSRFVRNPDVVLRRVAGEKLLIPVKGKLADLQNIFVLEGVGEALWSELDGELRLGEIVAKLAERFGMEREVVAEDCERFVEDLMAEGLVEDV